ncbi:MAG: FtsX-like permease family protein, partial [Terriglobus sp.]
GAVGVAMAMRTHLLERMDSIAIMKSLGAKSSHVLRIYLVQTVLLGLIGGAVGVALGIGVQLVLPLLLAKLLGITPELHIAASAIVAGLATGLLTTLLFTMPPLLDIRGVRPILILRRNVDEAGEQGRTKNFFAKIKASFAQIVAGALILLGITLIATTLSDSKEVGRTFTLGLAAVLLVLLLASATVLAVLRRFLKSTRASLRPVVRHGLANLYRPGNPSAALLAAVGLGVMQIASVFFFSQALVKELKASTRPTLPNVFLIDVSPSEVEGVTSLLKVQPGVRGEPEMLPVVASRIIGVDGVKASELKLENFPKRMLQSISLTWVEELPPGTKVVKGSFWHAGNAHPQVAIGQRMSERLHVKLGSHILFGAPGDPDHPVNAEVTAIIKSDGQHAWSRAEFLLPKSALAGLPVVYYGGAHADPDHVGELQRALFAKYPTVTVINVAQAMETLRGVLLQVSLVVQFLAGFSIFAGLVILASAIAGTRYRRIREVVVLKTLGATRSRIAAIFSIEFATLGFVAGVVGLLFANLTVRTVLEKLDLEYHFLGWTDLLSLTGVMVLTVFTGWIASFRVLGQKPLEVLREE